MFKLCHWIGSRKKKKKNFVFPLYILMCDFGTFYFFLNIIFQHILTQQVDHIKLLSQLYIPACFSFSQYLNTFVLDGWKKWKDKHDSVIGIQPVLDFFYLFFYICNTKTTKKKKKKRYLFIHAIGTKVSNNGQKK